MAALLVARQLSRERRRFHSSSRFDHRPLLFVRRAAAPLLAGRSRASAPAAIAAAEGQGAAASGDVLDDNENSRRRLSGSSSEGLA
jgi:hypothetical protein